MSRRPSRSSRRNCESSSTANAYPYVIIGDTAHAIVRARRLLKDGVTQPIAILIEGNDKMNKNNVEPTDFSVKSSRKILSYLQAECLHYIPKGNDNNDDDGHYSNIDEDEDQVVKYYHGSGICGDFISAYYLPRCGPWFNNSTHSALTRFIRDHSDKSCMTDIEDQIVTFLSNAFNVGTTSNFIVKNPAIQDELYTFIQGESDDDNPSHFRQLFAHIFETVIEAPNVNIYLECTNIKFHGVGSKLYDVSFQSCTHPHAVAGAKVLWETNPYTFLRLATNGHLSPKNIKVPVVYRAVVPIPKRTSVLDLSGAGNYGDLVTTYIPFALQDFRNDENRTCSISWLGNMYTAVEDLASVDRQGLYASEGNTLLIVEAISLINRRECSFNQSDQQVQVCFNSRKAERAWLRRFAELVAKAYQAYTGLIISPDTIANIESMCNAGACSDMFQISNIVTRESPMVTMIELGNHLYGSDTWPVAGSSRC